MTSIATHERDGLPSPSTYARLLLQRWPESGEQLLAGTDLVPDQLHQQERITVAEHLQIVRNARTLAATAGWALDFGRQFNINSHGSMGFASISAPTLGEGLEVMAMYSPIRAPYIGFQLQEVDRQLVFSFDTSVYPLADLEIPLIEILLQVSRSYIKAVLGDSNADTTFCVAHPARGYVARYRKAFGSRCEFSAGFNGVILPAGFKMVPSPLHDERIYRSSLSRCREALIDVLAEGDVVARVTHWLASHFEKIATDRLYTQQPHLEQLATEWRLTSRTIIRQLAAQNARFSDLRSSQQLDMARRMLNDVSYTVSEIGYLLGYGDPANFRRAFKRLTGQSPSDFRRRTR